MLDKNSKKVLKQLNKFYENSNFYVEEKAISQMCNIDIYQTQTILKFLISNGYIEKHKNRELDLYHPTVDGKNYFSNKRKEFFKILFNSIFCPIIVSLVTTLLTIWLTK